MLYIYVSYVEIKWPEGFVSAFKWTGIANLAILDISPVDCTRPGKRIDFYQKHTYNVLIIPCVYVGFVAIYLVGVVVVRWYDTARRPTALRKQKHV